MVFAAGDEGMEVTTSIFSPLVEEVTAASIWSVLSFCSAAFRPLTVMGSFSCPVVAITHIFMKVH